MTRERLDVILLNKGLFPSRQFAQSHIMRGLVLVDGKVVTKAGTFVKDESKIEVLPDTQNYVGRGGIKMEKPLKEFNINPVDRVCLDIGASTGGFTDCLLQNGAKLVYAIDVGYGQLEEKLRKDPRVINIEKTNVRYLTPDVLYHENKEIADLAVIDVSFISLLKILEPVRNLLKPEKEIIALIKPQFEAGPKYVRKGVIRSEDIHEKVLAEVSEAIKLMGFNIINLIESPIKGRKGNKEFFIYLM